MPDSEGLVPVRHVVLMGLMAVGKTTVGQKLAGTLGWDYHDNDAALLATTGATARELNERLGTDQMHRLEAEGLLAALAGTAPRVLGAAASSIEDPRCVAALSEPDVFAVWLRADPAHLATRVRSGPHRPELALDLDALLVEQAARRGPLFASVADLVVDVESATPAEIAARIEAALPR